jgi:C_GCAxxG_C_C family probable redox protein
VSKIDVDNKQKQRKSASSLFKDGFRCSQAVLLNYAEQFGLSSEIALKIATGFGGGVSRQGEICGAVTGAVMAIGLKFGQTNNEDEKGKQITYYYVEEFIDQFKTKNGSINCKVLTGLDLNTPEGLKRFRDEKINEKICKKYVEDAEEILIKIFKSWDESP